MKTAEPHTYTVRFYNSEASPLHISDVLEIDDRKHDSATFATFFDANGEVVAQVVRNSIRSITRDEKSPWTNPDTSFRVTTEGREYLIQTVSTT